MKKYIEYDINNIILSSDYFGTINHIATPTFYSNGFGVDLDFDDDDIRYVAQQPLALQTYSAQPLAVQTYSAPQVAVQTAHVQPIQTYVPSVPVQTYSVQPVSIQTYHQPATVQTHSVPVVPQTYHVQPATVGFRAELESHEAFDDDDFKPLTYSNSGVYSVADDSNELYDDDDIKFAVSPVSSTVYSAHQTPVVNNFRSAVPATVGVKAVVDDSNEIFDDDVSLVHSAALPQTYSASGPVGLTISHDNSYEIFDDDAKVVYTLPQASAVHTQTTNVQPIQTHDTGVASSATGVFTAK